MCNQVRGFHRGVRRFIAKIQMIFLNCAGINLCLRSYLFASQTELKVIGHHNTYVRPKLKDIEHLSDSYLNDILRPARRVLAVHASFTIANRNTHAKTRKLIQICKQVVTRLLSTRYQDVFALLVPSCCDKVGTSCYHLVTRLTTVTDSLQVVPIRLIQAVRHKLLQACCHKLVNSL
jgi:hypothetical protein